MRGKRKPGWRPVFLEALEKWGVVEHAARLAGVRLSTCYRARQTNPEFAEAWDEAKGQIVGTLEVLARQRASVGEQKPVIYQGKVTTHVREVDNDLLKWLLAHLKPEVYAKPPPPQDVNLNHSGNVNVEVSGSIDVKGLSHEQLHLLRGILAPAAHAGGSRNGAGEEEPL